jgi:hypothetical protein
MRQVRAYGAGPAVDELRRQGELVKGLIPELALRIGTEDPGADAGQRRGDDQAAEQARPGCRDHLRDPAADVIARDNDVPQVKFLDERDDAAGLGGGRVGGGRVSQMLV